MANKVTMSNGLPFHESSSYRFKLSAIGSMLVKLKKNFKVKSSLNQFYPIKISQNLVTALAVITLLSMLE